MRARVLVAATATLGALGLCPSTSPAARAQSAPQEPRVQLLLRLTSTSPGASSGLLLDVAIRDPDQPDGKAPQLVAAVFALPDGTVVDTSALPQCTASDAEIAALGTLACPEPTRVGAGEFQADTGFGAPVDPIVGDNNVFNGRDELVEIVTVPGTTAAGGLDRLRVSGSTLTANPPFTPGGPPDGRTVPRRITFLVPARTSETGSPYIVTPAACPPVGAWQTSGTFTFADGVTQTATDTTACKAAAGTATASPAPSSTAEPADPGTSGTAKPPAAVAPASRSLPTTGGPAALAVTGGALLLLSAGARRRRPA